MRINRRALIAAAAMASASASSWSGAASRQVGAGGPRPLPAGLWRSRRSAELVAVGRRRYRSFFVYDRALALVKDKSLDDAEHEILSAQVTDQGRLELERWGQVTRFAYDPVPVWPESPRYGDDVF